MSFQLWQENSMRFACVSVLLFVSVGCWGTGSPPLGAVTGIVTLDGKPVSGARVTFQPRDGGRGSVGMTDAEGKYKLNYRQGEPGAVVGLHSVSITTAERESRDKDSKPSESRESIPNSYNEQTTLTAEVEPGGTEIDFPLDSKAKSMAPVVSFSGKSVKASEH